jgi:hypothetical protein
MKLDCVLTAVNEKKLYIEFIPIFVKTWKKLYPEIDIKIILISNSIPKDYEIYKNNIILFKPLDGMSTNFISQYIRLLYPCILKYSGGIMISDMDILPMNRKYYTENIKKYDNNKFIYYRSNVLMNIKEIAMCYNVAVPEVWREIFGIKTLEDINNRLISKFNSIKYVDGHGLSGWNTDQKDLYKYVMNWNKKSNNLVCLKDKDTKFCRLDRGRININDKKTLDNIKSGKYSDYHSLRPFSKYKNENMKIYDLL